MYTPGPWRIKKAESKYETPYIVGDGHDGCAKVCRLTDPHSWGDVEANARLIAAAPDLLAALTSLVNAHDEQPPMLTADEWDAARAAIAKATKG